MKENEVRILWEEFNDKYFTLFNCRNAVLTKNNKQPLENTTLLINNNIIEKPLENTILPINNNTEKPLKNTILSINDNTTEKSLENTILSINNNTIEKLLENTTPSINNNSIEKPLENKLLSIDNNTIETPLEDTILSTNNNTTQLNNKEIIEQSQLNTKPSHKKTTITQTIEKTFSQIINTRPLSNYQEISKKLSIQNSLTSHEMFVTNQSLWHEYHYSRDLSFKGYDNQSEIPLNKIITYLSTKKLKNMVILDLGCGRNLIKSHFEEQTNVNIIGYDHVSFNGSIQCDISTLPNEDASVDICIFSQSLMGSNWKSYLEEAIRVLKFNGEIIVSESVERYDIIKQFFMDKGLHLKIDNYVVGNRWFYLHVLNDSN